MATHSSILAWKVPWTRGDWQLSPCGHKHLNPYPDSATFLSCDPVHNWIFLNLTFLICVMKIGLLSLSSSLDCYVDWNKKNCRKILWRIGTYDHNTLTLLRILSGVCAWPRERNRDGHTHTHTHTHRVCAREHTVRMQVEVGLSGGLRLIILLKY